MEMDVFKVKIFVSACVNFGILGYLNIDVQELIELYKECLIVAQSFEDHPTVIRSYFQLGYLNGKMGCTEEALINYKECLNGAEKTGDKITKLETYKQQASIYMVQRKYDDAIECLVKSLNISIEICDKKRERDCNSILGWFYCEMGKHEEAIAHHESSLGITLQIGDDNEKLDTYNKLGMFYKEIGLHQKAVECWKKGLGYVAGATVGDPGEKIVHACLGDAYNHSGNYNEAIESYKRVLEIGLNSKMLEGECYEKLGNCYTNLGKYDETIEYSVKWLEISRETKQDRMMAMAYFQAGVAYRGIGKFEEAIKSYEESLNIGEKISDHEVEMKANFFLGSTYTELVQPDKAIHYYKKSLQMSQEVEDQEIKGCSLLNLGFLYKMIGEFQEAVKCYEQSLDIYRDIGDSDGEASCYVNLGIVSKILGNYKEASEFYKKSLDISVTVGGKEKEGIAHINLGCVKWASGEQLEANEHFEKALTLFTEIDCKERKMELYEIIGAFYDGIGKYNEAIDMVEKSLEIAKQTGNRKGENNAKKSLVTLYLKVSKFQDAKRCLQSLEFELIANDKVEAQSFYYDLGFICKKIGKTEDAVDNLKTSLYIAQELGKQEAEGFVYVELGDTSSLMEKFDDAIQYCEKSLSIAKELKNIKIEASAYRTLGSVHRRRSLFYDKKNDEENRQVDKKQSIQFLNKSLELWDLVYDNLKEKDDFKVSIVDTYIGTYDELVSVLIEDHRIEEALLMCDRGRARALGDLLVKKYNLSSKPDTARCGKLNIDDVKKLLQESKFCVLEFSFHEGLVAWTISKEKEHISIQLETIASVNTETQLLVQSEIYRLDDINLLCTAAISAANPPTEISESQECENRSLEFFESDQDKKTNDKGFPDVHESMSLPIVERGTTPGEGGSDGDQPEDTDPLELLYTALLDSVLKNTEQEEIVVIPHEILYRVPFAALKDPKTKEFLSESKRIRLAPSLTTLKYIQECPDNYHCKTGVLIVGDPDVGEVMLRGKPIVLPRLPSAKHEAEIIGANLNVRPLIGSEATKEMVKQKLREGVAVIHIAAHGDPEKGHIALAPSTRTEATGIPEEEDYMLTMQEVQEIGVRAQLVVLSCCYSGRGEIKSEGLVGMSRAFLAAGARAVVASLWGIKDEATRTFMVSFYMYLQMGESASTSLQKAMKDIREEGYDKPKYWAPFFLIGDDVTISV